MKICKYKRNHEQNISNIHHRMSHFYTISQKVFFQLSLYVSYCFHAKLRNSTDSTHCDVYILKITRLTFEKTMHEKKRFIVINHLPEILTHSCHRHSHATLYISLVRMLWSTTSGDHRLVLKVNLHQKNVDY